ncbi:MAG: DNA replication/repair protein RecF [Bacteroidaceae bacterium]|nr:DNA replication/repair protein RecF [Bacteroidaceae bacterium]
MYLEHLFVADYRNLRMAELQLSPKINCFAGNNGVGKTNLLDAVYYLSFCKSAVGSQDIQIIRHEADSFQLQGAYILPDGSKSTISCVARRKGKKQIKRDKKEYQRFSEHIGYIPLVMVSPADTQLILGGSEERRKFMDIVISQYDKEYLKQLINYNKALTQRNTMLKMEIMPDPDLFLMWEQVMSDSAAIIYNKRKELIDKLIPYFQELYAAISGGAETVSFSYTSHLDRGNLLDQLTEGRLKDHIVGYTLHGIHKDDLIMELGGYPIKKEGSQGQSKSYLTALKFAQYMLLCQVCNGKKPILLLDDIFDKLDSNRVNSILKLVADDRFGQIFITDVNRTNIEQMISGLGCDYKIFSIDKGTVI